MASYASRYFSPDTAEGSRAGLFFTAHTLCCISEPALEAGDGSTRPKIAYRLLVTQAFGPLDMVRLTEDASGRRLTALSIVGKQQQRISRTVTDAEWANVESCWEPFLWQLSPRDPPDEWLADGSTWVVEEIRDGRHRVVSRGSPDFVRRADNEVVFECGMRMLLLAGISL